MLNLANIEGASAQTLELVKQILGGDPAGRYLPGVGIQKDITVATGLVAYNLEAPARLLVPVITPLRNRFPRKNTGTGSAANWKVITALDTARVDIFTAEGTKAGTISYTVTDKSGAYKTISKGENVTFQAQWAGKGFEDVRANAAIRLLKNVMIHEEQGLLGGRNAALGTVTAPTLTTATTGGSIPDATYTVKVRAITNLGRGKKSSGTSTGALTGTGANVISGYTPWVEGATHYAWYVDDKLETTTQINSFRITSLAAGAAIPADNDSDSLAFDGVLAQLTSSTAQVTTLATGTNGTGTAFTLADIDNTLQNMWDNAKADPDAMFLNSEQSIRLTNLVLAANGGPTQLMVRDGDKSLVTGGYRVTGYVNPVTGKVVEVVTHPYMHAGTIVILSLSMPFADSNIDNPIEVETRQEYLQLEYPVTKPAWEFEVLVDEVLKIYYPAGCGVIRNCNTQKTA